MVVEQVLGIQPAQVFPHARNVVEFAFPRNDASRKVENLLDGSHIFARTVAVHCQSVSDVREDQGRDEGG